MFGPSVTISEVFAYLGGAFLLAAWSSFMARTESGGEAGVVLGAMALVVVVGTVVPAAVTSDTTKTVAVVQGNVPELNFDYNDQRRVITRNNAGVTNRLAEQVQAGSVEQPDLVVWPENS